MKASISNSVLSFFCWLIPLAFVAISSQAQQRPNYPQNYFRWPVDITPEIVANMGELRSNHWHMGLDVRTNQRENLTVRAAAAGYISKIRIERFGFGRCIWIEHPNGYTSLYAHLNRFFPALENYVEQKQYENESWGIELTFTPGQFPVSKGQFIAYSGNTGGSQGPHVHFEIRDTRTGECLNPLLFGMPLADNVKPVLAKLSVYDRNRSVYDQSPLRFPLRPAKDGYLVYKTPVIQTGFNRLSFSVQMIDKMSRVNNQNGVYSARLYFDEQPMVSFVLDSIGYDETRYMNAHIDFKYRFNGGPYFQNLFRLPGDLGGVYRPEGSDGTIVLNDTSAHQVKIEVRDAKGNLSKLNFLVQWDPGAAMAGEVTTGAQQFIPNHVNILEKETFEAYLPETCLYDTVLSFYHKSDDFPATAVSARHQLNEPSVPVHDPFTVRIKPERAIGSGLRDRIIIKRSFRNRSDLEKAKWEGEWMSARFDEFGYFQAFADTEPPVLNSLGKGDTVNLSAARRIVFTPTDEFGIRSFRAELDGRWLRFTNDKGRNWIYVFDERCPYGVHELKVTVEDIAGNQTVKSWWFRKDPYKPPSKKKKSPGKRPPVKKKK